MRNRILVDSSFLFTLYNQSDEKYNLAQAFAARSRESLFLIPDVILPEVTFLFARHGKIPAVVRFLQSFVAAQPSLEAITIPGVQRAHEIMSKYASARFDFVDCCIMVLSERLGITQVCTFDRRDFGIYRRTNGEPLELLP